MKKLILIALAGSMIILSGCSFSSTTSDDGGTCSIEQTTGDCAQ